jgi:hypothetical protein
VGWVRFIQELQTPSDINPSIQFIQHPAAQYLHRLSTSGIPAPSMSTPWSPEKRKQALRRGAHKSATRQFRQFLHEDMADYIAKRFWTVLPYPAIKDMPHLKLAPCGVVPQRERRPRPIIDYTFSGVNQDSLPLAPAHSMQFGSALQRILQRLAYANPSFGPVHMLKFDLSDGYYRVRLSPKAALELAVIIPGVDPQANLIGIPLSLPMGWAQSPPYFCAFTETAADLANSTLHLPCQSTHPLELLSQQQPHAAPVNATMATHYSAPPGPLLSTPLQHVDVYMDDFIALAQHPHLPGTLHHTLQSIFQIFRDQSTPKDPPQRRHIISTSKIEKGDATWSPQKVVLGWLINAAEGTLRLQPHKADRLKDITEAFTRKSRTSRKQWMRLLGELRYMATAIPGARYLFSVLQHVLKDQPKSTRVRLNPLVKQSLRDWGLLARSLHANPMPIAALVPRAPHYLGAVDASRTGCGGFWIASSVGNLKQPTAFRLLFSQNIQQDLVSSANPTGSITNSDLELASLVLGAAVLQDIAPTAQACAFSASDNTPAVSWVRKGSTTSIGANAHLLRWLASLTRASNLTLHPVSVPGSTNTIADFLSRSFYLDDQALLAELNKRFPTQPSWQLAHPTFSHEHELISALSRKPSQWHSATHAKEETARQQQRGKPSVTALTSIPPWPTAPTPFHHCNYLPIDTEQEKLLPAALKCAARQWETPFVPWDRRSPSWASQTQGSPPLVHSTSAYPDYYQPTQNRTAHPHE